MVPVSVLPVAGILLGVGAAHFTIFPAAVSDIMTQAGGAIFGNLPLLFAVGVALGFTRNDGIAALASVIGYAVMISTLGVIAKAMGVETKMVMGIATIETGVFGGILIGGVSAALFNKFHNIQLPPYLGFFAGKRFIPIITSFGAIALGLVLAVAWPPIGNLIASFSHWAASENPGLAFAAYGIGERALIPFGLHHIWNVPFFFETGSFTDPVTGKTVAGEIARYLSGDPTAGNLAGGYLFKMWGLPAAAIAMWHSARPENKKRVAGIMISAALTSFVTGITEPIEFSFLFVAPILYAAHALLAGAAFFLCILLGIKHGTTFSHGLIDFVVLLPKSTNAAWLLVIGPIWAALYYGVFRFVIAKFNLATPGRTLESEELELATKKEPTERLQKILSALGSADNIQNLDACITRLRVTVKNEALVEKDKFKSLGAAGVLNAGGGNFQIIFGTESDRLKEDLKSLIANQPKATSFYSPIKGTVVALEKVPDATFSGKILGEGIAIEPSEGIVYAPLSATVAQVFRTNHAIALRSSDGAEILIHVGIDTVKMNGNGFKALVAEGDLVTKGQKLLEFDLDLVKSHAASIVTPIVFVNMEAMESVTPVATPGAQVSNATAILSYKVKK